MKTLAELVAEPRTKREARTLRVCLAPDLVDQVTTVTDELANLPMRGATDLNGDPAGPPRRLSDDGEDPRAEPLRQQLKALLAEMAEYEGDLRVEKVRSDGQWRQWVNDNPARRKGEPGHERDVRVTGEMCDTDALIEDLGKYVVAWNNEPLTSEHWTALNVRTADRQQLAALVVGMYEGGVSLPLWRRALSETLGAGPASISPAPSESPSGDSSDGNPPSDTNTSQ